MKYPILTLAALGLLATPMAATAQDRKPAPTEMQKENQTQSVPMPPDAKGWQPGRDGKGKSAAESPSAEDQQKTAEMLSIDVVRVAQGYRASEIIGSDIRNKAGDKIGSIDDLVVQTDDKVVFAIVSVGGFLGLGERLIAVPYDALKIQRKGDEETLMLPDATKAQLEKAPEFKYAK